MDNLFVDMSDYVEDTKTDALIGLLKDVKARGYLNDDEFVLIGMWKSPRQKHNYIKNSSGTIKDVTKESFKTIDEREKVIILTRLKGVSVPTASAILTLTDPENYGVIDIRVWQALYKYGLVKNRSSGVGLSPDDWTEYLDIIRSLAKKYGTSSRAVEQVIFLHHKNNLQTGTLYKKSLPRYGSSAV